ncbi:sce7726 family protein [Bradyrhizobium sp. ERR14]|uniref:sce7726 family protein n=1 Tax=Bradyrhizobium sp. ERR14 TaxID=2663837 RepID=UPI00161FD138|nr:sce7726 family protein [Bradyrhizobium sp. ERR14]MBB4397012.1 hypothetical protein [Bradyrhizobium sp. ERR14]
MTRLFSSAVFREMAKRGRSALFTRLLGQTQIRPSGTDEVTVADAFNSAFQVLKTSGLRDEYIYRAALTQKVLMGKHSLNTACMLNEFRAGTCKADLVILNGTATVYEIKSERDSLDRLANQINNYKKVFAKVYVIASEGHVQKVLQIVPRDVGVLELSRRYRISTMREAADRSRHIDPVAVFESLRSAEAQAVLGELGVTIPDLPNTKLHSAMRELFRQLDPRDVQTSMVKVLKQTRDLAPLIDLVERLPASLHAAALSIPVRRADHERLVQAVETPLRAAMAWA